MYTMYAKYRTRPPAATHTLYALQEGSGPARIHCSIGADERKNDVTGKKSIRIDDDTYLGLVKYRDKQTYWIRSFSRAIEELLKRAKEADKLEEEIEKLKAKKKKKG